MFEGAWVPIAPAANTTGVLKDAWRVWRGGTEKALGVPGQAPSRAHEWWTAVVGRLRGGAHDDASPTVRFSPWAVGHHFDPRSRFSRLDPTTTTPSPPPPLPPSPPPHAKMTMRQVQQLAATAATRALLDPALKVIQFKPPVGGLLALQASSANETEYL